MTFLDILNVNYLKYFLLYIYIYKMASKSIAAVIFFKYILPVSVIAIGAILVAMNENNENGLTLAGGISIAIGMIYLFFVSLSWSSQK
tara:strand:- start:3307 stop:3570 length:264 start_codon:yes stop_codon:yes gene_type:complete